MAVLGAGDRAIAWAKFMEDRLCPGEISKAELLAAVDAIDDWVESKSASFNSALDVAFRTAATEKQKAALLLAVVDKRYNVGGLLGTPERSAVWAKFMEDRLCPGEISKAELLVAVGNADDWVEANQAQFNAALPVAFRNAATTAQKAALFSYVVAKRYDVI